MSTSAPTDEQLTDGAEALAAEEVVARMVERFHPRLLLASSFQQEESVLIDLLVRVEPRARIFTLDTGVLFPETYATWRAMEQRWGIEIEYDVTATGFCVLRLRRLQHKFPGFAAVGCFIKAALAAFTPKITACRYVGCFRSLRMHEDSGDRATILEPDILPGFSAIG